MMSEDDLMKMQAVKYLIHAKSRLESDLARLVDIMPLQLAKADLTPLVKDTFFRSSQVR